MVFGGGGFERGLGHEASAFMIGTNAHIKETSECPLYPLPWEDMEKRQLSMNQEVGPHQTLHL